MLERAEKEKIMTAVSSRLEDYLETLFRLESSGCKQTVTALAENLKLTKGTIATVVKKMAEQDLVWHETYGAIRLTPKGRRIGWQVYMKHERLTSFFHDFLGQDVARSEEIACLIEHHLDGAAANRFFNLIDFLQDAQAGQKEWTRELFPALNRTELPPAPLTLGNVEKGRVCRLTGGAEINRRLAESGIVSGCCLEIVSVDGQGGGCVVKTNGRTVSLEPADAATVWVV